MKSVHWLRWRWDPAAVMRDSLTGLPSRAVLVDRVDHALQRCARSDRYVAVVVVDVDDFRSINAAFGEEAGDEILVSLARRLTACARASDTVARSGDDEFTVVLEDLLTPAAAYDFGARVIEALAAPLSLREHELVVTVRLGIAVGDGRHGASNLLAEAALATGGVDVDSPRNRYQVFESGMRAAVAERLSLRGDLVNALAEGQIVPFYQPIIDLQTKATLGYEGLIRWRHPRLGLLGPDRFLGVAEQSGLMDELGGHMLNVACRDALRWHDDVSVAVNLSAAELQRPKLVGVVEDALAVSGLRPGRLTLEVTEHSVIGDLCAAATTLRELADLGVVLSVDDFGTGHASLRYLERFPTSQLKIDKSFVARLADESGRRLVGAAIALGQTLGHEVIAEGVESEDQAEMLTGLGCRAAQGYLFGVPAPLDADVAVEAVR